MTETLLYQDVEYTLLSGIGLPGLELSDNGDGNIFDVFNSYDRVQFENLTAVADNVIVQLIVERKAIINNRRSLISYQEREWHRVRQGGKHLFTFESLSTDPRSPTGFSFSPLSII